MAEADKRKTDQGKLEASLPPLIIKDVSYFHRLAESGYLGFFPIFSSHTVLKNSGRNFPPLPRPTPLPVNSSTVTVTYL